MTCFYHACRLLAGFGIALHIISSCAMAQGPVPRYRVDFYRTPIRAVIDSLKKMSHHKFIYEHGELNQAKPVTYQADHASLDEILSDIFSGQPLSYKIAGSDVFIRLKPMKNFWVQVYDAGNKPLPEVSILNMDNGRYYQSGEDGQWQWESWKDSVEVELSYVGFITLKTVIKGGKRVVMHRDASGMNEVVEDGYGKSSTRLMVKDIFKMRLTNIGARPNNLGEAFRLVPGLLVTSKSDIPWATMRMQVRGSVSLFPFAAERIIDEPLFIINGVPCPSCTGFNDQLSSALGDPNGPGAGLNPLAFISADDVESIEVLKDAAATAIYGARSANGVILITLKRPKEGGLRVSIIANSGVVSAYRLVDMLDATEYNALFREAYRNSYGQDPTAQDLPFLGWDSTNSINWHKWLFSGEALNTTAQVRLTGGSERIQWQLGMNYKKEGYVYPVDISDQWVRALGTLSYKSRNRKFTVHSTFLLGFGKNQSVSWELNSLSYLMPHINQLTDSMGGLIWTKSNVEFANPKVWFKRPYDAASYSLLSNLQLVYRISNPLLFRLNLGVTEQRLRETAVSTLTARPNDTLNKAGFMLAQNKNVAMLIEPQIELNVFPGPLKLQVLSGMSYLYSRSYRQKYTSPLFGSDETMQAALKTSGWDADSNLVEYKLQSLFTRLNVNWHDRYIVELTGRVDGSSRIAPDHRWGWFGAVGVGWIFLNTKQGDSVKEWLSYGKLSASLGITGNDNVGDYQYMGNWRDLPYSNAYGTGGLTQVSPSNPFLKWATNKKFQFRLDFDFFRKYRLSLTYYQHRSTDQPVVMPLSAQSGFTTVSKWNYPAEVDNNGFELFISKQPGNSCKACFSFSLGYTLPRNRLRSLPSADQLQYGNGLLVDEPISARPVLKFLGFDPGKGTGIFKDENGDSLITDADRKTVKHLEVKGFGTFQATWQLDKWTIGATVEQRYQPGYSSLYYVYNRVDPGQRSPKGLDNQPASVLDRWQYGYAGRYQQPMMTPDEAYLQSKKNLLNSDAMYTNMSFISLRTLVVQYQLDCGWLRKRNISQIRLFVQSQNLLVISNYPEGNPMVQNAQPAAATRAFLAGLQVELKRS